jgi:3-oxoacyl-[acyl-carrier protein] reductase
MDFAGKSVLVVGGASGIGNAIAQAFLVEGADVMVWGTRPRAEDYADEESSNLTGLTFNSVDVRSQAAIERGSQSIERLDVLVASQGTLLPHGAEFSLEGFTSVVALNLTSVMACAMQFLPLLKASKGTLIAIGSTAGLRSRPTYPAYAASKAGLDNLIRSLAVAWAAYGIRVNAIAPGLIYTRITRTGLADAATAERVVAGIPIRRVGTAGEVAAVALFLASPAASYILGQSIVVDGGRTLA